MCPESWTRRIDSYLCCALTDVIVQWTGVAMAARSDDARAERITLADLAARPAMRRVLIEHAYRGIRVQFGLRFGLLVFMALAVTTTPPAHDRTTSFLIVVSYLVWTAGVAAWARRGGSGPVRWMWLALFVDAGALAALTLVAAGTSAEQSWTADLLVNGFFVIPLLAATQLRPMVCALATLPALAAYVISSAATKTANTEPWGSIVVRSLVLAAVSAGCVALTWVQRSRVLTIAALAEDRTELLNELVTLEQRERAAIAEQLHDGALQYVLAARQDLEDLRIGADPASYERIEFAFSESSGLLRRTVSELHPAVLKQAGLSRAIQDLVVDIAARGRLTPYVDTTGWPDAPSTLDSLLYGVARELLTNVVKHANAATVGVELAVVDTEARLSVRDDGQGMSTKAMTDRVAEGHIGLASLGTRIGASGGTLDVRAGEPSGTVITALVPFPEN